MFFGTHIFILLLYYIKRSKTEQVKRFARKGVKNEKNTDSVSFPNGRITQYTPKATKQEIHVALKLIEFLYLQGEIPKHVYRNIFREYYGKGLDITADACYNFNISRDAV